MQTAFGAKHTGCQRIKQGSCPRRGGRRLSGHGLLAVPTAADGKVVYPKGNNYIVDAVRSAVLAREQERLDDLTEVVPFVMPVMTDPVFW